MLRKQIASRGEPHSSGIQVWGSLRVAPPLSASPFSLSRCDSVREAVAIVARAPESAKTFLHSVHKSTV